jgi:protein-disulfide isomerase
VRKSLLVVCRQNSTAILVIVVCAVASVGTWTASLSAGDEEVAAIVDGRPILRRDIDARIALPLARLESEAFSLRMKTLRTMVDESLLAGHPEDARLAVGGGTIAKVSGAETGVGSTKLGRPEGLAAREQETRRRLRLQQLRANAGVRTYLNPNVGPTTEIRGNGPSIGPADAVVTIVQFSDFQCPYCRALQPALERLVKGSPDVRIVYRHLPLDMLHPTAVTAAQVASCANEQGRFWEFSRLAFAITGAFSESRLNDLSRRSGADQARMSACLASGRAQLAVQADIDEAERLNITSTPVMFINGKPLVGYVEEDALRGVIDTERRSVKSRLASAEGR